MKKLIISSLIVFAGNAMAIDSANFNDFKPYVGMEGQLKLLKEADQGMRARIPGAGIFGGFTFNSYFGLEAGTHLSQKTIDGVRLSHSGMYATALGHIPLEGVTLSAGAGFSNITISSKFEGEREKASRAIPRLTAGLSINHTDNISTRYMAVWEKTSKLGKKEEWNLQESLHHHVGVVYTF